MSQIDGSHSLKFTSEGDGLHLKDSILWLDSRLSGKLSFVSSAESGRSQVPQVIATEETIRMVGGEGLSKSPLVCQYNRPFSIGRLKMELLPSGTMLGGASLYVETDDGRFLYAPQLHAQKVSVVRTMQLKKAQTLVLGAYKPANSEPPPSRKKEKDRLVSRVRKCLTSDTCPVIYCSPYAAAQELTELLNQHQIPVAVHRKIYKYNRIYEQSGCQLGQYAAYSSRGRRKRVVLMPLPESPRQHFNLASRTKSFIVEEFHGATEVGFENNFERFILPFHSDLRDLKEIIAAVNPKEVYFFGPYAKQYCDEIRTNAKVMPLTENHQPALL